MDRRRFAPWPWLASRLCVAGLPLLAAACTENSPVASVLQPPPVLRAAPPDAPPENLPPPRASEAPATPPAQPDHKVVPITLDTVFRLAEEQNLQVGLAHARVDEALAQVDLAAKGWLPEMWVGTSYYRHEGGIQNEDGTLITSSTDAMLSGLDIHSRIDLHEFAYQKVSAERKAWQQRGELSKITSETLLEAASTYVDLLAAQTGRAIALQLEKDLNVLLKRAQGVVELRVEVARLQSEIEGRRQNARRLEAQAAAASAKLVYLLGLEPCTELVPIDCALIPYNLVDANQPCCELVGLALAQGPGIQELSRIVSLIDEAMTKAQGPSRWLPVVEMRMTEGAFGADPGAALAYSNRWDMYVQAKWSLTDLLNASEKKRIAFAQRQQAQLAFDDLRAKLAAGVQEARATILGTGEEIQHGVQEVKYRQEARKLSQERLDNNIPGSSHSEVMLSLQALGLSQLNYIAAIRDYNKAELRLLVLTGGSHAPPPLAPPVLPSTPSPPAEPKEQK